MKNDVRIIAPDHKRGALNGFEIIKLINMQIYNNL